MLGSAQDGEKQEEENVYAKKQSGLEKPREDQGAPSHEPEIASQNACKKLQIVYFFFCGLVLL